MDREKERERLCKQLQAITSEVKVLKDRLQNENFIKKAPPDIVTDTKRVLEEKKSMLIAVKKSLSDVN